MAYIKKGDKKVMIEDKLEIIIPTFNREKTLKETLVVLLDSPVKDCQITILNNNSSDETEKLCLSLSKKHDNIKYIKNHYNLGLAGNLCKALTIPTKKYFWVIFDDTGLDFTHWKDIEKGLNQDADCILTTNYYKVKDETEKAPIYLMLIYMFSAIFKSDLITDDVILSALTDIYTVHPQMALISTLFNDKNRKIYVPEETITFPRVNPESQRGEEYSFNRANKSFFHFRISQPSGFFHGFLNAIQSLKDEKLKEECIGLLFEKHNSVGPYIVLKNIKIKDYALSNFLDILIWLPKKHRNQLLLHLLKSSSFYKEKTKLHKTWYVFGFKIMSLKRKQRK